jgi:protein-disulfide isomerase
VRTWAITFVLLTGGSVWAQKPAAPAPPPAAAPAKLPDAIGNVDLSGLTPVQKKAVLKLLEEEDCSCQCGLKTGACIMQDPSCSYSRALAGIAIKGVKDGKALREISKLMDASPKAHRPKVLEDPVTIPVVGAPTIGPSDARITIVEFSDFECPYCAIAVKQVKTLMAAYPKDIRLIYKQFPLSMHPHAELAAEAALAANEQGKFWEMHDILFANFRKLSRENMLEWAQEIGLDVNRFKTALDSGRLLPTIKQDTSDGDAAGVYGTPAFFINGKLYNGAMTMDAVKPILEAELKGGAKTVAKKAN